jgi:hypothetical protein
MNHPSRLCRIGGVSIRIIAAASAKVGAMTTNQPAELSDADRETYINQCGLMVVQAMAQGQRELARHWFEQKRLAIFQRSPEQQARMSAEIDRRIWGGTTA